MNRLTKYFCTIFFLMIFQAATLPAENEANTVEHLAADVNDVRFQSNSITTADSNSSGDLGRSPGVGEVKPGYALPEWIEKEGIRAGFLGGDCNTNFEQKMKAVGLNTAIVTRFYYNAAELPGILNDYKRHGRACTQIGMHMLASYVWQPGGEWRTPKYRSVVFADGSSGLFPCPLGKDFWQEHLINIMVKIAEISHSNSVSIIDGIFLDMEMYGTEASDNSKRGYSFDACFCDYCFSTFIINRIQLNELPPVPKDRRKNWLTHNGYLSGYYAYLGEQVEAKAELLKKSVHNINPKLLFGVYPALNETNWVQISVMRAFGRNSYPVVSFTTDTYGYPRQGAALIPADLPAYFEKYNINGIYCAGYLLQRYTSSEIESHLIKSCQTGQGYWLFTMRQLLGDRIPEDAPLYKGNQADYLQAIKSANQTLVAK